LTFAPCYHKIPKKEVCSIIQDHSYKIKVKNIAFGLMLFVIFTLMSAIEAQANRPSDFLIRNYTIGLEVDCLEEALLRLGHMPGIVINSRIHIQSDWGTMDRRVAVLELDSALEQLHSLGRVVHSESSSQNVFSMVTDLRSEFQVRSAEYDRMMELLHEVTTIDNFTRVENRLVQVISEMEHIRGRLNFFEFETGTARIHITLNAVDPLAIDEIQGPLARIGNAFINSFDITLWVLQMILIVIIYLSVPLLFISIFVALGFVLYRKRKKNRKVVLKNEEAF